MRAGRELAGKVGLAEPEVGVTFGRALGRAEWALGEPGGVERVMDALASARRQHLLYEVYCCLSTLVEIADAGGPAPPPGTSEERDDPVQSLGITAP